MKGIPDISDAEWEVMKVVWDLGPITSGDLVKHLEQERATWKPRTIKTLLARLVKKGAVGVREEDKRFLYSAKVTRDALVRRESRSFLRRVFDGAVTPALVHFIQDADLSKEQVDELKRILRAGSTGRRS